MRAGSVPARACPRRRLVQTALTALCGLSALSPAAAERIENQVAVFAALDKVTARISKLEAPLGETVQFGALKVTARTCFSRPPTEQPKTSTYVDVEEIQLDGTQKQIFSGWMFAESPGLNAVEHPVFDVWLTECQKPVKPVAQKPVANGPPQSGAAGRTAETPADEAAQPRRRVRR